MKTLPSQVAVPAPVADLVATLEHAGHEAWCVGGALRDAVLGLPHADFDIATSATPEQVRRLFRHTIPVGEQHGTVGVLDATRVLHEVTTFRRDVRTDGRHAEVAYGVSLEEDLARRDFTINALAYHPLRHEWRDPFRGAEDLADGRVRAVGDAATRFREDYLRVLRAIRFAARFGFAIVPETWVAMMDAAPGLRQLSVERVRDEWFKGLRTAQTVSRLVDLWRAAGAGAQVLPELLSGKFLESALSQEPRDPVLLTTMLTGDPAAVLRRLRASNAEIARAAAIAAGPEAPATGDVADVRRWLARVNGAADDLLRRHELRTGISAPWAATVAGIRERGEPLGRDQLALRGGDLLELGLRGPEVGQMIDRLLERVLEDPALNTRDTLLALVREAR
ncbi:MAG TPA: CCA tRNA nucleotidyltransferase [Gemmatimonadales bacterium]|nr:CCA tRNA nucleotidyltransferase [Gemmatimonadales bacterium]